MKLLGWNFSRGAELRATVDFGQAVANALQELAEQSPVKATGLAVVETCVSLIAEPFLVARLSLDHSRLQGRCTRLLGTF